LIGIEGDLTTMDTLRSNNIENTKIAMQNENDIVSKEESFLKSKITDDFFYMN